MSHVDPMRLGLPAEAYGVTVPDRVSSFFAALLDLVGRAVELRPIGSFEFAAEQAGFAGSSTDLLSSEFDLVGLRNVTPGHYRITVEDHDVSTQPRIHIDSGSGFDGKTAGLQRCDRSSGFFSLYQPALGLRLVVASPEVAPRRARVRRLSRLEYYGALISQQLRAHMRAGKSLADGIGTVLREVRRGGPRGLALKLRAAGEALESSDAYQNWIVRNDTLTLAAIRKLHHRLKELPTTSSFAILMPVSDAPLWLVERSIASVRAQVHHGWRIYVIGDCAARPELRAWAGNMPGRGGLELVDASGQGSMASALNAGLARASEDFVVRVEPGDMLRPTALAELALDLHSHPEAEIVYTDEDRVDLELRRQQPSFKPDFSPELFRSCNYLGRLTVHRSANVRAAGAWREGFPGGEDYDLNLRIFERVDSSRIRHIPKVLYHSLLSSALPSLNAASAETAKASELRALRQHVERTALAATVEEAAGLQSYRLRFAVPTPEPRVSVIIPTRDGLSMLRKCIDSIRDKTTYANYEIVVVDNGSVESDTLRYFGELTRTGAARVLRYDLPFNYSAINNFAAGRIESSILALVNNDIEVISADWLTELVSWAVQPEIGCVGAMLYYGDDTIQHAGVVLGIGGMADHAHLKMPRGAAGYEGRALAVNNYSAVTGACLVIRKSLFEEVGGLDEANLAVAFNDVDLCLKVGAAGYRNVWTPYAELYHHESQSRGRDDTPEKRGRYLREVAYMRRTWAHILDNDPYYSPHLSRVRPDFSLAL